MIALGAGALLLSATSSTAGAAREASHTLSGFAPRAAHANHLAPTRVTKKSPGFDCISSCTDYMSTIDQYFTDVATASVAAATDNVYSVMTQYSGILNSTTFGGSYVDGSPYPTKLCRDAFDTYCLTDAQLATEIGKVIAANGWPTHTTTDLYFIFTPANVGICQHSGSASTGTPCTTNAFCAYHGSLGDAFIYVVEPDDAAVSQGGCDTGQSPAGNAADSTISTISHEHIEAVTDPYADGWWSEDPEPSPNNPSGPSGPAGPFYGSEIADLCAWNFGDPLGTTLGGESYNQVINGHNYFLQTEYSNADAGCVQYAGGDVTSFDPSSPLYPGVGPLVYHRGAVMTSTTIRAIYWIPAGPANSHLPTIAGSAKVGKKLRALHGAWSNSPTFAYRWLRCSAAGTSCKGIKKATDSAYTVAPGDAGHGLEVRVTATNPGGSANATSAPTGKVRS